MLKVSHNTIFQTFQMSTLFLYSSPRLTEGANLEYVRHVFLKHWDVPGWWNLRYSGSGNGCNDDGRHKIVYGVMWQAKRGMRMIKKKMKRMRTSPKKDEKEQNNWRNEHNIQENMDVRMNKKSRIYRRKTRLSEARNLKTWVCRSAAPLNYKMFKQLIKTLWGNSPCAEASRFTPSLINSFTTSSCPPQQARCSGRRSEMPTFILSLSLYASCIWMIDERERGNVTGVQNHIWTGWKEETNQLRQTQTNIRGRSKMDIKQMQKETKRE